MLPPETSSNLVPWRVMVTVMQACGSFPYRMSVSSAPPTFSLPLFLWAASEQLLLVSTNIMTFSTMYYNHIKIDIGIAAYVCTSVVMMVTLSSGPVILTVKSPALASLLHDLSAIKGVSPPSSHLWYRKPQTLALLSSLSVFIMQTSLSFLIMMEAYSLPEGVLHVFVCFLVPLTFLIPVELPSMMFSVMARRLLAATEATVDMVSTFLTPDGSFKCESDQEAALLALRDLEVVIQEVEEQREAGTRCFFPVVSMYLLMAVVLAIGCPYAIMNGVLMGGNVIGDLLIGFYVMVRFSCLGQAFVSQVVTAEKLLKKTRVKSQNLCFNNKVSQVMGSLSPMLIFDMCGWYRLDYASFFGLMNTVLTYLVIIFQVGGNTVENVPYSFSSSSNSSAPISK